MAATSLEAIRRITIEAQERGLADVAAKLDKVTKAQEGVVASSTSVEKSSGSTEQAFKKVERSLDTNVVAYDKYARSVKAVSDAQAQGIVSEQRAAELYSLAEARLAKATGSMQQYGAAAQATAAQVAGSGSAIAAANAAVDAAMGRTSAGVAGVGTAAGPARHELINLSRQIQDVGVQLAGGQGLFTIIAQQGPQIADVFLSSKTSVADFASTAVAAAGRFISAWGPIALAVGAVTTAALAAKSAMDDLREARIATTSGPGRRLGVTAEDVNKSARSAQAVGMSIGEAREGITAGLAAGAPSMAIIEQATAASLRYAAALKMELIPAQKEMMAAFADPTKGVELLEQRLKLGLSPALKETIQQLQASGQTAAAAQLLFDAMSQAIAKQADSTSALGTVWAGAKTVMTTWFDALGALTIALGTLNTTPIRNFADQFIPANAAARDAAAGADALRLAMEKTNDAIEKSATASNLHAATMQATTVESRAAASAAETENAVYEKTRDKILAAAEGKQKYNEVMKEAAATSAKTVANQQIEIEINGRIIDAYRQQSFELEVVIAKLKEEQAVRQAGLSIQDADSQRRLQNAGTLAKQQQEISDLAAEQKAPSGGSGAGGGSGAVALRQGDNRVALPKNYSNDFLTAAKNALSSASMMDQAADQFEASYQKIVEAETKASESAKQYQAVREQVAAAVAAAAQTQAQLEGSLQGTLETLQLEISLVGASAAAHAEATTALQYELKAREAERQGLDEAAAAYRKYGDAIAKATGDLVDAKEAEQKATQARQAAASAASAAANTQAAKNEGSFAAGGDKPLSQRGGFTSTAPLTWVDYQDRARKQNEKAAEVQTQAAEAEKAGQQRQLSIASSTIQDQISALNDQRDAIGEQTSALDEQTQAMEDNTSALEKESAKRREQLDKQIAKLEKALTPSRPDPYAERNPDYFYRFGTQAFKENDPTQALLAAAEAERDGLDKQLDAQKEAVEQQKQQVEAQRKAVELQQKAIDAQIKGYETQAKQLDRAGNLLSAGVELSAQEVSGLQAIIAAIGALGDSARLQQANVQTTLTAQQAAAKSAGDPASEFAGTYEYAIERMRRGAAYEPVTPPTYGFQKGNKGFSGFFASGGYIPPGSWGIAGESGPEVVRRKRAVAGPATVTPIGAGRPIVVNQTFVSQGGARELRASRGEIAQRSSSEVRRSLAAR